MRKKDRVNINSDGGPVFLGNVDNRGTIKGRIEVYQRSSSSEEATRLFNDLFQRLEHHPRLSIDDRTDLRNKIEELRNELDKKEKANESFILRRLRNIKRMAPDILEVTLAVITSPSAGFGLMAKKIAERIKSSAM